jgi:YVTN family beta-propeller protein
MRNPVGAARGLLVATLLATTLSATTGCTLGSSVHAAPRETAPLVAPPTAASIAGRHITGSRSTLRSTATRMVPPSDRRWLHLVSTIGGPISPKSVVASQTGLVFAQNMMYRHTITVYSSSGALRATIPDGLVLSSYGVGGHPGLSRGAPVEAAFSPDRRHAFVSNYSMYGAGFGPEGSDVCTPASAARAGVSPSYVYRINTSRLKVDGVIRVGLVPKFLTVTPDGRYLLVSDWCSYAVSVVDLQLGKETRQIYVGAYPRGIAVTADSATAYVAVMGSSHLAVLNLRTMKVARTIYVGNAPRHVVMDPAGRYLYVTLNGEGAVAKLDLRTSKVVARQWTGRDPRSMAIAPDGRTLYVVNYFSNGVSVLRSSDLAVLQHEATGKQPIGITYDNRTNRVWVALYSGKILVFAAR